MGSSSSLPSWVNHQAIKQGDRFEILNIKSIFRKSPLTFGGLGKCCNIGWALISPNIHQYDYESGKKSPYPHMMGIVPSFVDQTLETVLVPRNLKVDLIPEFNDLIGESFDMLINRDTKSQIILDFRHLEVIIIISRQEGKFSLTKPEGKLIDLEILLSNIDKISLNTYRVSKSESSSFTLDLLHQPLADFHRSFPVSREIAFTEEGIFNYLTLRDNRFSIGKKKNSENKDRPQVIESELDHVEYVSEKDLQKSSRLKDFEIYEGYSFRLVIPHESDIPLGYAFLFLSPSSLPTLEPRYFTGLERFLDNKDIICYALSSSSEIIRWCRFEPPKRITIQSMINKEWEEINPSAECSES